MGYDVREYEHLDPGPLLEQSATDIKTADTKDFRRYVPHKKQAEIHSSEARIRFAVTGNRFGKTDLLVNEALRWAEGKNPWRKTPEPPVNIRYYIDGYEGPHWTDVTRPKFQRWLNPVEWGGEFDDIYRRGERLLVHPNGSMIRFLSYNLADMTRATQVYGGAAVHLHILDEHGQVGVYREAGARFGVDVNPEFLIGYTPLLGTACWEYSELWERWQRGEPGFECFTGTIWDNPYLDAEAVEAYLRTLPPEERDIREAGLWKQIGGSVYGVFDRETNVIPFDPRIVAGLTKTVIIDPHPSKPTAVLWCGIGADNRRYAYREMLLRAPVPEVADAIRSNSAGETIRRFVIDKHWGWENTDLGKSIHQMYIDAGIKPLLPGYEKIPPRIERVRQLFDTPGVGKSGLCVMDSCPTLIRQIERNQFKPQTQAMTESDRWVRIADDDDLVVCLEYYSMSDDVYVGRSERPDPGIGVPEFMKRIGGGGEARRWGGVPVKGRYA